MFSLSKQEILRISQSVTSSDPVINNLSQFVIGCGQLKYETLKHAQNVSVFTENGVAMLSSVLKSQQAVEVNIQIMRTFTRLRNILTSHREVERKLKEIEAKYDIHDEEIETIFQIIRKLATPPKPMKKKKFGFQVD
jgi:hypothetical protein